MTPIHDEQIEVEVRDVRMWERKVLTGLAASLIAVFGTWALVVYRGTQDLVIEMRQTRAEMVAQMTADRLENAQYRTLMERRVTILEQRQGVVLEVLRNMRQSVPQP